MSFKEQFIPKHPNKFTLIELNDYKIKGQKALGKLALGPIGIAVLGVGGAIENIPTAVVGTVIAGYGLLSGMKDVVRLTELEREAHARPQAESLPLEFNESPK